MRKPISEALPGFVGLREFFRRLGDDFDPIALDDERQEFYVSKIEELRGCPEDLFFNMKWAWRIDPHFREARRYSNGMTMVRIGVGAFGTGTGLARDTRKLLLAFDAEDRLVCYTVLAGRGWNDSGVKVVVGRYAAGEVVERVSYSAAVDFVRTMIEDDFFVIADALYPEQYFQVLAGREDDGRVTYAVEYCLEPFVLHFALPYHVEAEEVIRLISVLREGGYAALQEAEDWCQVDAEGFWQAQGKTIDVDIGILAHIYRTEVVDGDDAAADMREVFDTRVAGERPLTVRVSYGTPAQMRAELLELAEDDGFTDAQRKRIALFVRMMSQDERCLAQNP